MKLSQYKENKNDSINNNNGDNSKNKNDDGNAIIIIVIIINSLFQPGDFSAKSITVYSVSLTLKLVKKVISNLDLSKATVVLKNCGFDLSYILDELFNMGLKYSSFPDCWKVSSVVPVFKNVGEKSRAKNYHLVFFNQL